MAVELRGKINGECEYFDNRDQMCSYVKDFNTIPLTGDESQCIQCRVGQLEIKYARISDRPIAHL